MNSETLFWEKKEKKKKQANKIFSVCNTPNDDKIQGCSPSYKVITNMRHDANFVVTDDTGSCWYDNCYYHKWRPSCQHGNSRFLVYPSMNYCALNNHWNSTNIVVTPIHHSHWHLSFIHRFIRDASLLDVVHFNAPMNGIIKYGWCNVRHCKVTVTKIRSINWNLSFGYFIRNTKNTLLYCYTVLAYQIFVVLWLLMAPKTTIKL